MISRRSFVAKLALTPLIFTNFSNRIFANQKEDKSKSVLHKPVIISTWDTNLKANESAWEILKKNGRALDAIEKGINVTEADPNDSSVGYGGLPDRDGNVTLDACIMDEFGNCGSVAFLQHIMHPISVARKIMENTPYIMLAGDGALKYALDNGFKKENLLTEESKKKWELWLKESNYKNHKIDKTNHDTIGMIALDNHGNISGGCSTSGLKYKYYGRVGDSPIIGAGLYVDNEIGAAAATGKGEAVMKTAGTFLAVEFMRQGHSPDEACRLAIERIAKKNSDFKEIQVGLIAINKSGETGAYSINKDFSYCLYNEKGNKAHRSDSLVK